ncbi:MAG: hypothetical protein EZS28_044989, partial [Streblomastix strix]
LLIVFGEQLPIEIEVMTLFYRQIISLNSVDAIEEDDIEIVLEEKPNDDIRNQGIRIMKNKNNWDSFVLTGCNNDPEDRDGVWKMGSTSSQFRIQKQEDQAYDYKGLIIDFDCTSLKFNNQLVSPLPTPPVEQAIKQSLVRGIYESFAWGVTQAVVLSASVYLFLLNYLYYQRGDVIGSDYYVSLAKALAIKLSTYYKLCWLA